MKNANYRKHNDRSLSSGTYHKKDGTASRAILKREARAEVEDAGPRLTPCCGAYSTFIEGTLVCRACCGPAPAGSA